MARTLDGDTTTAVESDITRPLYLIDMGFDTPIYYSTREQIVWDSKTWLEASIKVLKPLSQNPVITIFNEHSGSPIASIGMTVLAEGTSGKLVNIYQAYGKTSGYTTPILIFSGEMGESTITKDVVIHCKRTGPSNTPRLFVTEPTFNHCPKAGSRIETANNQVIILESN